MDIEQIIAKLDLDEEFDKEISINRLCGNRNSVEIVKSYLNCYYNDLTAGRNPTIKPLLLIGDKSTGISVFARSISNFFGNLMFHTISGTWLSDGVINLSQFFNEGDRYSTYYIFADKLSSKCQMELNRILTDKQIRYYNFQENCYGKRRFENRLIILATEKKENITYPLLKQFHLKINLTKLTVEEVEQAVKQRLDLLGWKISSENLISKIAQCGEIGQAMETLSIIYMVMRSKNQDLITEEHVATAISLNQNILSNLTML